MVSLTVKKYLIGAAVASTVIGLTAYWFNSQIDIAYNKGVSDTVADYNKKEKEYLLEKAEENVVIVKEDAKDKEIIKEQKSETTVKVQKVIEYVEKEVEVNIGCEALAADVIKLRTEATNIINSAARGTN